MYEKEKFYQHFETQTQSQKIDDIRRLVDGTQISEEQFKLIQFNKRKDTLEQFLRLIKANSENTTAIEIYRQKYNITIPGEEEVWAHLLTENKWILGLSTDTRLIRDFLPQRKVGVENSQGQGSPKPDFIGLADFTTLIELKTARTEIFTPTKGKLSRANT